jgi:hypothetical protein
MVALKINFAAAAAAAAVAMHVLCSHWRTNKGRGDPLGDTAWPYLVSMCNTAGGLLRVFEVRAAAAVMDESLKENNAGQVIDKHHTANTVQADKYASSYSIQLFVEGCGAGLHSQHLADAQLPLLGERFG